MEPQSHPNGGQCPAYNYGDVDVTVNGDDNDDNNN